MKIRLDKYLADMGKGTRSEVKKAISKGLVRVNNVIVKKRKQSWIQIQTMFCLTEFWWDMHNMNIIC